MALARLKHDPPPILKGFSAIHRYFDGREQQWVAQVLPGEFYVTKNDEIITTVLGSCVATCIHDPIKRFGGLNHFMLPHDLSGGNEAEALRYGCFAVERLINELVKYGARRETMVVKVFGGGRVIAGMGDVGKSNIDFVRSYLTEEGFSIAAEDVGGRWARRLRYHPTSGKVLVKHLETHEAPDLADERQVFEEVVRSVRPGEIELFG